MIFENTFHLQPNPASKFVTVDYFVPMAASNAELTVTSITGQKIKSYPASKGKQTTELNIEDVTAGVYFLNLLVNNKTVVSRKMVVVR